MSRFIPPSEVKESCSDCCKSEERTSKKGNTYYFCNEYGTPCFNCMDDCEAQAERVQERAIDRMEQEISRLETDYTGEYRRGF